MPGYDNGLACGFLDAQRHAFSTDWALQHPMRVRRPALQEACVFLAAGIAALATVKRKGESAHCLLSALVLKENSIRVTTVSGVHPLCVPQNISTNSLGHR